jgi:hypothetical protein
LGPSASAHSYVFDQAAFVASLSSTPTSIVVADFNGDGRPDVAVASVNQVAQNNSGTVSIFLGQPAGTLGTSTNYNVGHNPVALATGDFNGDGKLDLVVVNQIDNTVSVLLGNGDGTFQAPLTSNNFPTDLSPNTVVVGDFNGDGKLDLAVGYSAASTTPVVSVLLGNGDGTFQPPIDSPSAGIATIALVAADFNRDGKLDLALTAQEPSPDNGVVAVLFGTGDGRFQSGPVMQTDTLNPQNLITADFNGDGRTDLAFLQLISTPTNEAVTVLLNNGDGTFQPPLNSPLTSSGALAAGDFNGDGKLDLAVGGPLAILLGNGDGTFQPAVTYGFGFASGLPSGLIALGDLNGDGKLDVVAPGFATTPAFPNFEISVLLGNGDGTFSSRKDYATGATPLSVAAGDFTGDGSIDLAVADSNGCLFFLPPCQPGLVSILLNSGNGTFQTHVDYPAGVAPVVVATGDFNGDGKLDLAVVNQCGSDPNCASAGTVSILLGNGDGTFQSGSTNTVLFGPDSLVVGDFNGDGKLDLAVGADGGAGTNFAGVSVLLGNGDGTFAPAVNYTQLERVSSIAGGDFNGDGKEDLALTSGNLVSVLLGNGDGTFRAGSTFNLPLGYEGYSVVARDFNGDGKLDLAVGGTENATAPPGVGFVNILLGNGDGTFQAGAQYISSFLYVFPGLSVDDVNGDGKLDLVLDWGSPNCCNNGPQFAGIMPGNGDGTFQPEMDYPLGNGYARRGGSAPAMADFNGEGGLGMAMVNPSDNTVSVYLATPVISLFPLGVSFGSEPMRFTSAPQTVTISNPGSTPLAISNVAASGDFALTNACGATLAVGQNCAVTVTFTPTAVGARTGAITVTDNAPGSPQIVKLTGTGASGPFPVISLSVSSLDFGTEQVGTGSPLKTVTLTNTGTAALSITSITASGDFKAINTCKGSVAVGASCTFYVTFKPTAAGTRTGAVTIADNAPSNPQTIALTGTVTAPAVTFNPTSLVFGNELTGQASAPLQVTLTNDGSAPLVISGISFAGTNAGDFSLQNTCPSTLGAESCCAIGVTFNPTEAGSRSATLTVSDNAAGSPQSVALSGTGLGFSLASVGTASATVTAGATANYTVAVDSVGLTGSISFSCSGAPAQATCSVTPSSVIVNPQLKGVVPEVKVAVTTTARSASPNWPAPPTARRVPGGVFWMGAALWLLAALGFALGSKVPVEARRRRSALALTAALLGLVMVLLFAGCGGGGSSVSPPPSQTGTPAGTYTLTVAGTFTSGSASVQNNISLTLTVQ